MLNNFIYSKTKDLFLEQLEAGNVLDEAIVFIEDTKEIWNHGTYFDCSTTDFEEVLKNYVIKDDIKDFATKDEISDFVTSSTLQNYVDKTSAENYIDKSSEQAISGLKTFNNIISINSKTSIRPNIDSGELKITHNNSDKGFIIRTKNCEDTVLPLEILSTNGYSSYQYNFPKTSGTVALGIKKGNQIINANLSDGLIELNEGSINITYQELKTLRDNSQLITGQNYRITDYRTTAIVNEVADHKFDIIVTALDTNILSENAKVVISEGELGSKISELFSWEMNPGNWLSISDIPELQFENSTIYYQQGTRTISQAGVIKVIFTPVQEDPETNDICIGADLVKDGVVISKDYHVGRINYEPRQEENNEYILTVSEPGSYVIRYFVMGSNSAFETNLRITAELYDGVKYFSNSDVSSWEIKYCLDNDTTRFNWAGSEDGKGVIYYMKDDHDNECPYDFKNILFNGYYTFSYTVDGIIYDGSVKYNSCYGNKILGTFNQDGTQKLNKIIFKNTASDALCCYNSFGWNNENNNFGSSCASNTFGNYCINNSFGDSCQYNIFGDYCQSNTFTNFCQSNSFGTQCQSNSFGSYILRTTFGRQCLNNKFTNSSSGSDLLEACRMIKFGDQCNGVNLYTTSGPSYNSGRWMQNITVSNALSGNIEITTLNDPRNLCITKSSDNSIHKYYESDLISNVKTINGQSLVGEGNIDLYEEFISYDSLSNYIVQDLYTEPSLLPYKFMGHSIYQLLIPRANFINNQVQLNLPVSDLVLIDVSNVGTIKTCLEASYNSGILTVNCANENAWDNCRYIKIVYTSIPPEKQGLYFITNKPIDGQLKLDDFPLDQVSDTEYVYRYGVSGLSSCNLTYSINDIQVALSITNAYAISDGNIINNIILNNNMYQYTIQLDPNAKLYEIHLEII